MEESVNNRRIRAEVKLPLILIHTPFGLDFFDRVAKWRIAKVYADFNTYLMPLITGLAIFLILGSLAILVGNSGARDGAASIGPQANLLIPGLNPYLPLTYGWVALVVTIIIHEAGHGIVARVYNVRVDSTGIVLLLGLPIGAFVNIERDQLNKTTLKQKSAVLTAGPLNNMILAGASLVGLFLIIATLTPLPPDPSAPQFGIMVVGVDGGSLATSIGIEPESVIQYIDGQEIRTFEDLRAQLATNVGNTVDITWINSAGDVVTRQATLVEPERGQGILGVRVTALPPDPQAVLDRYESAFSSNPLALLLPPTIQQGVIPYSDLMAPKYESSVLGSHTVFAPIANMLFWLWFINFNVGIFNALPIGPLDGGQLYGALIEKRAKSEVLARNTNRLLTLVMAAIVAIAILLPYVPF